MLRAAIALSLLSEPFLSSSARGEATVLNQKAEGYQGIRYQNQPLSSEYAFKYSGGLGTYCAKHKPFAIYSAEANKTFFCYDITASDSNYDMGSLYLEDKNVVRHIAPTGKSPQPFNPGGEIEVWCSDDGGANWAKEKAVTAGSEFNHTYLRRPANAHPDFYAFWADGHGRKPSASRLYFCDKKGNAFRLPTTMGSKSAKPERTAPRAD